MPTNIPSLFAQANKAFRENNYALAEDLYKKLMSKSVPPIKAQIEINLKILERKRRNNVNFDQGQLKSQLGIISQVNTNLVERCATTQVTLDDKTRELADALINLKKLATPFKQLIYPIIDAVKGLEEGNKKQLSEILYAIRYPDVKDAVDVGHFNDCYQHFSMFGNEQGRIYEFDQIADIALEEYERFEKHLTSCVNSAQNVKSDPNDENSVCNSYYWDRFYQIVPHYLSKTASNVAGQGELRVAVHLHLYYIEMIDLFESYLANVPVDYDLYISVPIGVLIKEDVFVRLRSSRLNQIFIEEVPNKGRDIGPLIIQFGRRLLDYDVICHVHSKKTPHVNQLAEWGKNMLDQLLGSDICISNILSLLVNEAKFVFPEDQQYYLIEPSGWGDNKKIAEDIFRLHKGHKIDDFPVVRFPQGMMFWSRTECLKDFLTLPIEWSDFDDEPINPDGTLAHALERIVFILNRNYPGKNYRLHKRDSISDRLFYEAKKDYSGKINSNVKVLSYYLPQFHPIPENDEWHGKGFTEWTKVSSANPLFYGHYQQHIPHPDIGYYLLDSPEVLKKQAELMKHSGVYGQVFYHYWFSGKQILHEPAEMLLNDKSIDMPFCFCWANENWTRRWDGNEAEILLQQNYSESDARRFISYLIPFFNDRRYIRVDSRPILFVYRPSSIELVREYVDIWADECHKAGLQKPYLVAVLTRGATHPDQFGFDAGVERVLHDWTNGAVDDIKDTLDLFGDFKGTVLSYDEVANYYSSQLDPKDFTYFRSIVPIWDNTARYGNEAYVVHGSKPEYFQNWLEKTIDYTEKNLPVDRQFVVVNAWNEWAEGAHLEPDTFFGYSYLNSVGRALSKQTYRESFIHYPKSDERLKLKIIIPNHVAEELRSEHSTRVNFFSTFLKSTIFKKNNIEIIFDEGVDGFIQEHVPGSIIAQKGEECDYVLTIRQAALVSHRAIEEMLLMALANHGFCVISNTYDNRIELPFIEKNLSVPASVAYQSGLIVTPSKSCNNRYKFCPKAKVFLCHGHSTDNSAKPQVTTVIRFHASGCLDELENALLCLYAMFNVAVIPMVQAQDLNNEQKKFINFISSGLSTKPIINYYTSSSAVPDMRSVMLNEGLRQVKTRYAGILDYDDLLFPSAYWYMINRLKITGKAITFGRVFQTDYDSENMMLINRKKTFEYNTTYEEFVFKNHAPVHSFLIDLAKVNFSAIEYFDDHKYMEDYYMTLQLFNRDNCDWDSLVLNKYIGDYMHPVDRTNTLAVDDHERANILASDEYQTCEDRIYNLRKRLGAFESTKQ